MGLVFSMQGAGLVIGPLIAIGLPQSIGFGVMAAAFACMWLVPGATTTLLPFLLLFGATYFSPCQSRKAAAPGYIAREKANTTCLAAEVTAWERRLPAASMRW